MEPTLLQILFLGLIQGAAELLPVSSSAHVIVAEKLIGLNPSTPAMTFLLVMLHTGTMIAVIAYFWQTWRDTYFSSRHGFRVSVSQRAVATIMTGAVGLSLLAIIKHVVAGKATGFEIEQLFGNAKLMAAALASAGVLIIASSRLEPQGGKRLSLRSAAWIGAVQGLCLPFRGFSRSGATISTGLALGVDRRNAEAFSFALAVVLTPAVIVKEAYRVYQAQTVSSAGTLWHKAASSLLGMLLSSASGMMALRWLSRWLEQGRWPLFGAYCLVASLAVLRVG
jgi:undecaprenyl-diphosphatase